MARIANLKEHILETAKSLAEIHGISNLNVRLVAKESGIALGTIYNYYPAKGELIAAVIADFWQTAFAGIDFAKVQSMDYLDSVEYIYFHLLGYLTGFRENWLDQLALLSTNDKMIGRMKEQEYFEKIFRIIRRTLEEGTDASSKFSPDELEKLSRFIFVNMMSMLKKQERDFVFFKKLLGKILA